MTGETRKTYPQVHVSSVKKLPIPKKLITDEKIMMELSSIARKLSSNSTSNSKNGILNSDSQEHNSTEYDLIIEALS